MFLSRRATQEEYIDKPGLPQAEVAEHFRQLARVNRLFDWTDPFKRTLPPWLQLQDGRPLRILDLGAGDGSLGKELREWAARRGWDWSVTNLDMSPLSLRLGTGGPNVVGSVEALPFAANSFDLVIASQMTHHLTEREDVLRHFREAWRVTRDAVFFSDLHRHVGLYAVLWLAVRFLRLSRSVAEDGLLSVRRGWRRDEWEELASAAGLQNAKVWIYYGARIILQARKGLIKDATDAANATSARHRAAR